MDYMDYLVFGATLAWLVNSALFLGWWLTRNLKDPTEGGAE